MSVSPNLSLPFLLPSQAQKHVTHNEALSMLDALVQLAVLDRDLAASPTSPAEGDRYIVAAGASGAWAGHEGEVAAFAFGEWLFFAPLPGWLAWIVDEGARVVWNGSEWVSAAGEWAVLQNVEKLGLGTAADAANPFSARLNTALWTALPAAEGGNGDLRTAMSKEAGADVLSVLLQSGVSGRAEFGLVGDEDFTVKVSANGADWVEALRIDRATAGLSFAGQLKFPAAQNPSPDPNTLDDYEEGTFTPSFTAATPPTGVAYSNQTGRYTKIGRLVLVEGRMTLSSKGTGGAGVAQMAGLPYAGAVPSFTTQLRPTNVSLPSGSIMAAVVSSAFSFQTLSNVGQLDLAWSAIADNFDLVFSHVYST